jgi:hypothetical protein
MSGVPWDNPFREALEESNVDAVIVTFPLPFNLKNDFQLDGRAERKACDAIHQTARALVSTFRQS